MPCTASGVRVTAALNDELRRARDFQLLSRLTGSKVGRLRRPIGGRTHSGRPGR